MERDGTIVIAPGARVRPTRLAPGAAAFGFAWLGGLAIARLSGAAAVLLVLAAMAVAFVCALLDGWRVTRRFAVIQIDLPDLIQAGADATGTIDIRHEGGATRSVVRIRTATNDDVGSLVIPASRATRTSSTISVRLDEPGLVDTLVVDVSTAGISGLIWWSRRTDVSGLAIHVAPIAAEPRLAVDVSPSRRVGDGSDRGRNVRGEVDGVRAWRVGEQVEAVHWPTTVRSRTLMVRDRTAATEQRWTIAEPEPDRAGQFLRTVQVGLQSGHEVAVAGTDTPIEIGTAEEAARLAARIADRSPVGSSSPWWRREITFERPTHSEDPTRVGPAARWVTALASWIALALLMGALSDSPVAMLWTAMGLALGAVVTIRFVDDAGEPPLLVRAAVVVASIGALALVAVESSGIASLLAALRGPLPDLLMMLVVLHGFEASNRRTVRVHQAISAAVVLYAAGLRIDAALGWWLAVWAAALVAAVILTAGDDRTTSPPVSSTRPAPDRERWRDAVRGIAWIAGAACVTLAVLAIVPVPRGPASLGLPALSAGNPSDVPGALVDPDGQASGSNASNTRPGERGALGTVGGYLGFSEQLDTSIRGGLGDDVVMRVRAPEPAFWRGQTFADFDGRTWTVSADPGRPNDGPTTAVEPTLGDGVSPTVGTDELVQTYFIEAELPNVVFAAARPVTVVFDGTIWTRPDGALRSDVTLGPGSAYTVVSARARVTADVLRSQGDVAATFDAIDDPRADVVLAPYLAVPPSTSTRTRALAAQLAPSGQSTYDTILAYESWLANNTAYDLEAPVPADGADAVDDFLFESQRGFCEQIASALTVMLRTQGVPARLATGYLPGERDRVSGVWKVRARDAHAWVEVWFPETGWQAFDPTAEVPLAGDVRADTVGGDVAGAALDAITAHPVQIALAILAAGTVVVVWRAGAEILRRRRRGRWGLLQDRFTSLGGSGAATAAATNPRLARAVTERASRADGRADSDPMVVAAQADLVASGLDRAAFDPTWSDRDDDYERVAEALRALEVTCS